LSLANLISVITASSSGGSSSSGDPMPSGDTYTDIFTVGQDYYLAPTLNFHTETGVPSGSAIKLSAGNYGHIHLAGYYDDIWIMGPDSGMAYVNSFGFGDYGKNIHLIENPAASGKTLTIENDAYAYFAVNCRATGTVIIRNIAIQNCSMGIQVETRVIHYANLAAFPGTGAADTIYKALDSGNYYYWDGDTYEASQAPADTVQTLTIKNCTINTVDQEGMYIGSDVYSYIPITWNISGNTVTGTGRDGIQCRNGGGIIQNNTGTNIGTDLDDNHGHGILFGTGSNGCIIRGNNFTNIHYYGILVNGFGNMTVEDNVIDSGNSALYHTNWAGEQDYRSVGYQNITIKNNTLSTDDLWSIDIRRDDTKNPMTVNLYSDNTLADGTYIEEVNGIVLNNL
jgi:hypothetical protein